MNGGYFAMGRKSGYSKKIITFNMLLLLLSSYVFAFASCSESKAETNAGGTVSGTVQKSETDTKKLEPALPEADYKGDEFTILDVDNDSAWWLENFEFYVDGLNGEVLNDAIYSRNLSVEERFNVKIKEVRDTSPAAAIQKSINAGDTEYELCIAKMSELASMATNKYFYNFVNIPYVDLEKPWWDQNAVKSFSIKEGLYFLTGDYMLLDKYRVYCVLFNKEIAAGNKLGNLYDIVDDGKWTIDLMNSMAVKGTADLNGDSVIGYEDQYGVLSQAYDNFYGMVYGAGNRITEKDKNDLPVLGMYTDRLVSTVDKLINFLGNKNVNLFMQDITGVSRADLYMAKMFEQGQGLFYNALLVCAKMTYQDTQDLDFGIIPQPKYDERQENYLTTTQYTYATGCAVPINTDKIDMTGVLLEALSAESMYTTMPAFYEITIKTKYTPDEKAPIMLDMIFDNIVYDVAAVFDWGGLRTILDKTLPQQKENKLSSLYAASEEKALQEMQKTIDTYTGSTNT